MGTHTINGIDIMYFSDLRQLLNEIESSINDMRNALAEKIEFAATEMRSLEHHVYRQGVLDEDFSDICGRLAEALESVDSLRRSVIEIRENEGMPVPGKLLVVNQGVARAVETVRNLRGHV